ncbi:MAG: dockerin type I repeat-containing protein [Clostridia bacterium]|nr:dockerin type I repeat-containing protein [Clostridia bacterium]
MKKLIALLLALVMALSITAIGSVGVVAEEVDYENPTITIDGILDEDYPENRVIEDDWWYFFEGKAAYEPLDPKFLDNTLRFTWDNDFIYFYYSCKSKADLYKPAEGETFIKDKTPAEEISVYLDTAPSLKYEAKCQNTTNTAPCKHLYCNANDGEGRYHRLQARVNPAFNNWYNFYRADEGMFKTLDQFIEIRKNEDAYKNYEGGWEQAYLDLANGACESAVFVDYETNTYGCELKYRRGQGEDHFKCNFNVGTKGYEWSADENDYGYEGLEIPYTEGACLNPWMVNEGEGMFAIYYSDFPAPTPGGGNDGGDDGPVGPTIDPAVEEVTNMIMALPVTNKVTKDTQAAVDAIDAKLAALNEEQKAAVSADVMAKLTNVKNRLANILLAAEIGDVNGDKKADASDALEVLKSVVGKVAFDKQQMVLADVTNDGKADAADALDILKFVVGKLPAFKAATELLK